MKISQKVLGGYFFDSHCRSVGGKKSHTDFRLEPKLVTLNNIERRKGRYFALFRRWCSYKLRDNTGHSWTSNRL